MRVMDFNKFVAAREDVLFAREKGLQKPWTKDPILQAYRFCNVQREDDTVTRWIAQNWRDTNADHPDLFFAMAVARFINWPDTLQAIGFPLPWHPKRTLARVQDRAARGEKTWTGAYIVSTNGTSVKKDEYVIFSVLHPLYLARTKLRPRVGDTLATFAARLQSMNGFKGFMTGQVIADVKYAKGSPLRAAEDWDTWAASGPGSRRGLNRVIKRNVDAPWVENVWHGTLLQLRAQLNDLRQLSGRAVLHAQDVQNCLCEFDKYERVRLGEGKPRSRYNGT